MASSTLSSSSDSLVCTNDLESDFYGAVAIAAVADSLHPRRCTNQALAMSSQTPFFLENISDDGHFLDSCFLCKKPLSDNSDIFMYRGDTPFCTKECREEQMEIDEATEMNWDIKEQRRKKQNRKKTSTSPKSQRIHALAGTVVSG